VGVGVTDQLLPFFRSLIRHPYPHALGSSSP